MVGLSSWTEGPCHVLSQSQSSTTSSSTMADAEEISLEETNKIRISIGLKPLTDDKEPADSEEKQAEDNYAKLRERERKERETRSVHYFRPCQPTKVLRSFFLAPWQHELPSKYPFHYFVRTNHNFHPFSR